MRPTLLGSRVSVLLIEDNAQHVRLIRRLLQQASAARVDLDHAETLEAARERLSRGGIDIVLLDLGLPDSPLSETLSAVIEAFPQIPVVVLTSLADTDFAVAAVQEGAQDFLSKDDLSPEILARAIRYAIERSRNLRQLELKNEELRRFAGVLAHEVRNPLNSLTLGVNVLEELMQSENPASAREHLTVVKRAVEAASSLVAKLLEFSSGERRAVEAEDVDLDDVVTAVVRQMWPSLEQGRRRVDYSNLPTVRGDQTQLTQVFHNLLSNAVKFRGDREVEVSITAHKRGTRWRIEFADRGIGIPVAHRDRVFEMFDRGGHSRTLPGHGIGLAVCKQIVEQHQGAIGIAERDGPGTVFWLELPAAAGAAAHQARGSNPEPSENHV